MSSGVLRVLDVTIALTILIFGGLAWILVALVICLEGGGSALFRQSRLGRHGATFQMLKFRSMISGAELQGTYSTAPSDGRVTRIGKLIRRTSIDEIPQLWNVVRGDMSLVGPRPIVEQQVSNYQPEALTKRLSVHPGLTGLAQVRSRHDSSFEQVLAADLEWVERRSIPLYLGILARTAIVLVTQSSY